MSETQILDRDKFKKIAIKRFFKFNALKVDLYIKLGEAKLIKIVDSSDEEPEETITKYQNKGVSDLFMRKEDHTKFLEAAEEKINAIFLNDKAPKDEKLSAQIDAVETIHDGIKEQGIDQKTIDFNNKIAENTLSLIKKDNNLQDLISKILTHDNYISKLATMTSYLSISIATEMKINNPEIAEKLALAALIKDVIFEDDRLAMINDIESEEYKNLSQEDKQKVLDHPKLAKEILLKFKEYSEDQLQLISYHHERPDKKGFPNKISHLNIGNLCCVLIISNEYAHHILTKGEAQKESIIEAMKEPFSKGNFKAPFQAFLKIMS